MQPKKYLPALLFLFACFFLPSALAQTPDWSRDGVREQLYPAATFLTGFASEVNRENDAAEKILERVSDLARAQLAESVQISIRSEVENEMERQGEDFSSRFRNTYWSGSAMDIVGLQMERAYDPKTRTAYALAWARRDGVQAYYENQVNRKLQEAETLLQRVQEALKTDLPAAMTGVQEALLLLSQVSQAQGILLALKPKEDAAREARSERSLRLRTRSETLLRTLQQGKGHSLEDASFFLTQALAGQKPRPETPVRILHFTWQDSGIPSPLSRTFLPLLQSRLLTASSWKVLADAGTASKVSLLEGSFWEEGSDIKIVSRLKSPSGQILAASEAFVPKAWLESRKLSPLPPDLEKAAALQGLLNRDAIVRGNLHLEAWISKGDASLLFTEGETMKIYVRANRECHIRATYHLATGESVLLLDNYFIPADLVNRNVEIPDEFICSAPFGVETLQVNAQTQAFEPLKIREKDGYAYLLDVKDAVASTRGMKKKTAQTVERAEKRIVITTMAR